MERYKVIKNAAKILWLEGCPAQVEKYNILHDNNNGKSVIQLMLKNISDKEINNVFAEIVYNIKR